MRPDWQPPAGDVVAVCPTPPNRAARTRAFVDFLVDGIAPHPLPTWPGA